MEPWQAGGVRTCAAGRRLYDLACCCAAPAAQAAFWQAQHQQPGCLHEGPAIRQTVYCCGATAACREPFECSSKALQVCEVRDKPLTFCLSRCYNLRAGPGVRGRAGCPSRRGRYLTPLPRTCGAPLFAFDGPGLAGSAGALAPAGNAEPQRLAREWVRLPVAPLCVSHVWGIRACAGRPGLRRASLLAA